MDVPRLGAFLEGEWIHARAWAPEHRGVSLVLYDGRGRDETRRIPMEPASDGFFSTMVHVKTGLHLYKLSPDGEGPFPDPWSRSQPLGVHGPSEVFDESFAWTDRTWRGVALRDLRILELHVGTATPEGTFDALIPRLASIAALGITAIELMPVASFPGRWNWGYDGVSLFAPAAVYGGPAALRRLVDAAHAAGLAVILDVVYNHLGPDGNYLGSFSRSYFSRRHHTPWGPGLDLDQEPARELVRANAEMWIRDYHVDGLRLDATDAIADDRSPHILTELADRARAAGEGRTVLVIAEDDRNEAALVTPVSEGGYGLDAVWAGDFHHSVRRALTGDAEGLFADYTGSADEIARAVDRGWVFEGQASKRVGGPRGTQADGIEPVRFVHFLQNHDQVGNRALGARLSAATGAAAFRALSALLLLSPATPLLFMGEEWDASTPFHFFTDHRADLGREVREGRQREHPTVAPADLRDPQDEATFRQSKLDLAEAADRRHAGTLALHRELLALRATHPALTAEAVRGSFEARALGTTAVALERRGGGLGIVVVVNLRGTLEHAPNGRARFRALLTTEEERFGSDAPVPPQSVMAGGVLRLAGPMAVVLEAGE